MTSKNCTQCNKLKPLSEFYKYKGKCKDCISVDNLFYRRTKVGVIANIYSNQRSNSIKRHHDLPNYSQLELRSWALSNKSFHETYNSWVESGYEHEIKPSFDRLCDYHPYTLDNIQIVTWSYNRHKSYKDKKNGINNKNSKCIIQMSMDNLFIASHHSASYAARFTNGRQGNISSCCRGERNHSGGFRWMFSINKPIHNNSIGARS